MIPGVCNVCHTPMSGNESRGHIARCVEMHHGIRGLASL